MKQQEKSSMLFMYLKFLFGQVFFTNVCEYLDIKHTFPKEHALRKSTKETLEKGKKYVQS